MAFFNIHLSNLLRLPALVKIGQIVLLVITISIAQSGEFFPGFGGAVNLNVTALQKPENGTIHYIAPEQKHLYFYGAGICTGYLINCCILVICYLIDDTVTQASKFELGMSMVGSIFFLSLAMKILVGSSSNADGDDSDTAKLVTEGCCCLGVAVLQIFDAIFTHRRIKKGPLGD